MLTLELHQFRSEILAQGVASRDHFAFVCPRCSLVQSAHDWMTATGQTFEQIEGFLAFSCIGRHVDGIGCDWTLGGLLRIHQLEVRTPDGQMHPRFMPATPEQAIAHQRKNLRVPA